jgi:DNA gyrase subunit A
MAASRTASIPEDHGRIEDVDVSAEMQDSFLEYAYSVIYSRALPTPATASSPCSGASCSRWRTWAAARPGHVKSARVVGEVMGKLHPHGDSAIYDALVRLAQPFALRVPLVDGHGNFGSLDDGPRRRGTRRRASLRRARAHGEPRRGRRRLRPELRRAVPAAAVLPAAFPNLLVNGASGIAVGMATNMAPHNLNEVVAAAIHLLENPDATTAELMEFVPGPTSPAAASSSDSTASPRPTRPDAEPSARAKASIESLGPRRTGIVVTELPYMVGAERVIEKIKTPSTRRSSRASPTSTTSPTATTACASSSASRPASTRTPCSSSSTGSRRSRTPFGINNVALVDGQPQTLGLKPLLRVYLDHRIQVVTRRSRYRLARKQERLHLVEGLLIAILDIDEVIQVIRASDDTEQARRSS